MSTDPHPRLEAHCPTCHFAGRDAALIFIRDPAPRCPHDSTFLRPGPYRKPMGRPPKKRRQVELVTPTQAQPLFIDEAAAEMRAWEKAVEANAKGLAKWQESPNGQETYCTTCGWRSSEGTAGHYNPRCRSEGYILRPVLPRPPERPTPRYRWTGPIPGTAPPKLRIPIPWRPPPEPAPLKIRPRMNAAQRARSVLRWFRHVTVSEEMLRDLAFPIDPDIFEDMTHRLQYGRQRASYTPRRRKS
jgi:hypothetical protein